MEPLKVDSSKEVKSSGIGPGDRLQTARIEQGLSIEEVANRMHLSVSILQSIEDNNFDDITAPIFVKGYLRAYARIVQLNEEEMIQEYLNFYSDEDPPINSTSNTSPEITSNDARIKWTTYLVIIVLAGLIAAWWWNENQDRNNVASLAVEESTALIDAEPAEDNADVTSEISADSDEEVISSEIEAVVEGVERQPEVAELTAEITASVEIEAEVSAVGSEPVEELVDNAVEETENFSQPTGSDTLEIIIHADTWAEIKDSVGQSLVRNLLHADTRLSLTGEAPFSAFFGNGHGVELKFNDQEIDISNRIRDNNTARLKIGNN
ncbi:MAG: helix-turn-helix domain-containing protein [Gammaproteobacteria bacterium]|nr:helix-turn-helix domain-containing protein [Gammaproteobacteria bacterium]